MNRRPAFANHRSLASSWRNSGSPDFLHIHSTISPVSSSRLYATRTGSSGFCGESEDFMPADASALSSLINVLPDTFRAPQRHENSVEVLIPRIGCRSCNGIFNRSESASVRETKDGEQGSAADPLSAAPASLVGLLIGWFGWRLVASGSAGLGVR